MEVEKYTYTIVPVLQEGVVQKVKAPSATAALKVIASDMGLEAVDPSGDTNSCFFRALAIALSCQQAPDSPRTPIPVSAFLRDVDVDAMRRGVADDDGTRKLRDRMAEAAKEFVPAWDNFFQASDSVSLSDQADCTFAAHMKALMLDYEPQRGKKAEPSSAEEWCERIADLLRHRTSDQGQLALRVAATMLKVDIALHVATQSAPSAKRRKTKKGAIVDWDCSMDVVRYIPLRFGEEENGERMTARLGLTNEQGQATGHYFAFIPCSGVSRPDEQGANSPYPPTHKAPTNTHGICHARAKITSSLT
jgi:hypothetical protein